MTSWFSFFGEDKKQNEELEAKGINLQTASREEMAQFIRDQSKYTKKLQGNVHELETRLQEEQKRVLSEQDMRVRAIVECEEQEKKN